MNLRDLKRVERADVVIVGSGVAGLTAALSATPLTACVVTKSELGLGSSSHLAQGGVAVALGDDDSPELHARDTLAVGGVLSNHEVVEIITREGPEQVRRLLEMGAAFDRDETGDLRLGREAAHSRRRIVHANGDATGAAIVDSLREKVRRSANLLLLEESFALDLMVGSSGVEGVVVRDRDGALVGIQASATILATGGIGSLFAWTTNPAEATGDGLAMAARAGARLADLEFVQFHPTALNCGRSPMPLLTEALRGEGAVLIDSSGRRFMLDVDSRAELAPRDIVARAIWFQLEEGEDVFLDATAAVGDRFPDRFPTVFHFCRRYGFDPRVEPIPVGPAAHYHIGGIDTDARGRSSLAGLWACGEVAATQVHGANRLASNSLLEAMVLGRRVAEDIRKDWKMRKKGRPADVRFPVEGLSEDRADIREEIQQIMWTSVGLVRNEEGLRRALARLGRLVDRLPTGSGEVRNIWEVARLVTTSALARRESRGVHYRSDFPETDSGWQRHLYMQGGRLEPAEALAQVT